MKIEQIYTGCLAQGAYYITSENEAAIIDPLREIQPYLNRLSKDGVKLKYIFETHFHADFVSGHIDLSKQTGAPIVYGPLAKPEFEFISARDEQIFPLGKISIKVLHTPGHTMESTCYLLLDEQGKEHALFSGDTLFLGDVGRPDLAQKAAELTQEDLAGYLYESLMQKIIPLPNELIVYPAHGAGSACGKNMMKETVDTLGNQKKVNYALNQASKADFIAAVTEGLLAPPAYFPQNVALNKKGYASFDSILSKGLNAINITNLEATAELSEAVILDTRTAAEFAQGFIPKSINIGIKGDFAPWVGALLGDTKQAIILVTEAGMEEETITRLARVGFDNVLGYVAGGFDAWKASGKEFDAVKQISATEFEQQFELGKTRVIDVRKDGEYAAEHVDEAFHKPLASINEWINELDTTTPFVLHCQSGYRSMITASILQARGIRNFVEVIGGFKAIAATPIKTSDFVCQSKVLKA